MCADAGVILFTSEIYLYALLIFRLLLFTRAVSVFRKFWFIPSKSNSYIRRVLHNYYT